MKVNKRKCWICGSTSADPEMVVYRLPKPGVRNVLRCELWAYYMFPDGPCSTSDFAQIKLCRHAASDKEFDIEDKSVGVRAYHIALGPGSINTDTAHAPRLIQARPIVVQPDQTIAPGLPKHKP